MFKKKSRNSRKSPSQTDIIDQKSPFQFIEGYRSLRTNLGFTTFSGEVKTILVTSALMGDGKSSVSINLARILSMSGKKVLLIDGDMRSPSIHKYLRIKNKVKEGFSSVIAGRSTVKEAIYSFPALEIDVMLSGPIPPNASELLSHDHTRKILDELHDKYDMIIIDTPPSGIVTDAVVLSNYVDGVLFVVKQNYADKDSVKNTLKSFKGTDAKILGVVMNDYSVSKNMSRYRSYEYRYGYGYGYGYGSDQEQ